MLERFVVVFLLFLDALQILIEEGLVLVNLLMNRKPLGVEELLSKGIALLKVRPPLLEFGDFLFEHADTLLLASQSGSHLRAAQLYIKEVLELIEGEGASFTCLRICFRVSIDHIVNFLSVRLYIIDGQPWHQVS